MFFKFEEILFKVEKAFIIGCSFVMFFCVILQVFARYFNLPVMNTTEISLMIMSLLTFIGTSLIIYTKDFINIEVVNLFKSERIKILCETAAYLATIVFAVVFLALGYSLFVYSLDGEKTLELGLPLAIPFGSMLVGLACMIIHTIGAIMRLFGKGPSNTDEQTNQES